MSISTPTVDDVPYLYDVIIDGKGYMYLKAIDDSLPFRTHRSTYSRTQTFVERTNVSGSYGDNQQDFFLTVSQNDWEDGENIQFYRSDVSRSAYWRGKNIDNTLSGQVTLRPAMLAVTASATPTAMCAKGAGIYYYTSSTNLYELAANGTSTDKGAHGLGSTPETLVYDGVSVYISGSAATTIRRYNGTAFSTFCTTNGASSLAFLNNTIFAYKYSTATLHSLDTAGTATLIYTWKTGVGAAGGGGVEDKILPYGGQLLISRSGLGSQLNSELYIYNGSAVSLIHRFESNFYTYAVCEAMGLIFISGLNFTGTNGFQTVYVYANGSINTLWKSVGVSGPSLGICSFDSGVVWFDSSLTLDQFMYWNSATGSISRIGQSSTETGSLVSSGQSFLRWYNSSTSIDQYPATTKATSGFVTSSLYDFDNSLDKNFRSVKVVFDSATDGDGGSVDIAYRTNSIHFNPSGSYTNLQTGAASGTEYLFSSVTGRNISIKITLNKGSSTNGPILRRVYTRAAPILQSYRKCEYILDLSGVGGTTPVILNDNETPHPKTGLTQATNLTTSMTSTTPITIIDRFGTFTGVIEPGDTDIFEMRPEEYVARVTVREI